MLIHLKILFVFLLLVAPSISYGATVVADSCSQAHVQTAIDASSNGDTVTVPAGSCTWATQVTIPNTKGIILQGNGIDSTIITDNTATGFDQAMLLITGASGKPFRITGFTFKDSGAVDTDGIIKIKGDCLNWRIDNNKWDDPVTKAINVGDGTNMTYGVIDHNTFYKAGNDNFRGIQISGNSTQWTTEIDLGSANAVYIEDNDFPFDFKNDGPVDTFQGSRYVFRYNTVKNSTVANHGLCSSDLRSAYVNEFYNNTFTSTSTVYAGIHLRGGTGVIFDNTFDSNYTQPIVGNTFRSCQDDGVAICTNGGLDRCDGSSGIDQNVAVDSGTHTGSNNQATVLTDSGQSWTINEWVDYWVRNTTDGGMGLITENTPTTLTVASLVETPVASGANRSSDNSAFLRWWQGGNGPPAGWTTDGWAGDVVQNITDGSSCTIASNTPTTVTCTLAGGTDNDWDSGDKFRIYQGTPEKDFDTNDAFTITWGYPCLDQIGRGKDQALEPLYEWGNTKSAANTDFQVYTAGVPSCDNPGFEDHLVDGRDYINDTERPSYTPYTYPHPLVTTGTAVSTGITVSGATLQ